MTDVSNVIVISEGTAPVQLYLYLYRSLFDGVELCRHCPGVVDQALVHGTFLYPTNHFLNPTNLVHGVDDKEEAPTKSHLEWSSGHQPSIISCQSIKFSIT